MASIRSLRSGNTVSILAEAAGETTPPEPPTLLADGGVENWNSGVDELIESGILRLDMMDEAPALKIGKHVGEEPVHHIKPEEGRRSGAPCRPEFGASCCLRPNTEGSTSESRSDEATYAFTFVTAR